MTDVSIPYGKSASDTAVLLLAAAEEQGLDARVVSTGSFGTFYAPEAVAKAAGVDYDKSDGVDSPEIQEVVPTLDESEPDRSVIEGEPAPTAKKTTAKKTVAKKTK